VSPKLRVLLVIKCLGYGGAERLLVDMVAKGDRGGFDYEVAFVLDAEHALVPDIESAGTPVHALGARGNWDLRWMANLRTLIVGGGFDVVHFHLPYTAAVGRLVVATIPARQRPAVVYTEHSLWNKMAVLIKGLNRATIGRDQALVVVSEAAHDALPEALKGRARVIVHGVDLSRSEALVVRRDDLRRRLRSELGADDGELVIITVANLRPEKGYDVLLDAARLASDRKLPVRFAAVGRGPLAELLEERHHQLDLGDRFQFLGQRDDVLNLLVGADVFVLASRQEGLPVSLMEATSVGIAIVATSVGGVPQVITDGVDGLVVPPGDPTALVDALQRVVCDPALRERLGAGALRRSAMFDVTSASREVEGIYRQVAGIRR
jgi:glycosyltransferase involved in cell wall biosynthesis